jgi:plasmid stability protein
MATLTIRNLPDETHKALRIRAAVNGRSVEEEVRRILAEHAPERFEYRNPKTPEEIAEAVRKAQELFAPMRETYSVDQFIAEKREEAAREYRKYDGFNEPQQKKFEK